MKVWEHLEYLISVRTFLFDYGGSALKKTVGDYWKRLSVYQNFLFTRSQLLCLKYENF